MKNIISKTLVLIAILFTTLSKSVPANAQRLNLTDTDFEGLRVVTDSAWKTKGEAIERGKVLHNRYRFQNIGVLYIPYFRNLSGRQLYRTIIVPNEKCEIFLRKNVNRLGNDAYCLTPSNKGLRPHRRRIRFWGMF